MSKWRYGKFTQQSGRAKRLPNGRLQCACGKGYASEYDGLCFSCRGETVDDHIKRTEFKNVDWTRSS